MRISIICPTHNRSDLWRAGWLTNSLREQSVPPDELVIAIDNTDDDTRHQIEHDLNVHPTSFPVHILEVTAPRPEPFPASAQPDNCCFHYAQGDIILHVDDDIWLPPHFIELTLNYFRTTPNIALWYMMTFTDLEHKPLADAADWRLERIRTYRWQPGPAGLVIPNPHNSCATGAIFACLRTTILASGGHNRIHWGYHNQDTMLGHRLTRLCTGGTYIPTDPETIADHLGQTWHMGHRKDPKALRHAYGIQPVGPTVANGGLAFWTSPYFDTAYKLLTPSR